MFFSALQGQEINYKKQLFFRNAHGGEILYGHGVGMEGELNTALIRSLWKVNR